MTEQTFTIGFSNLDDGDFYAQTVRRGLEEAVAAHTNLRLITRDNALNDERALENARFFAERKVDLAIIYHITERLGPEQYKILLPTPVISVDIPIQLTTYVGINNSQMGRMAGEALADWVDTHWQGEFDNLIGLIEQRVVGDVRDRVLKAVDVMHARFPDLQNRVLYTDCGNTREHTHQMLTRIYDDEKYQQGRTAVIAFNDVSALGVDDIVREREIRDRLIVVGNAASDALLKAMQEPDTSIIGSTITHPERYGAVLLDCALRILHHEKVPRQNFVPLDIIR